MASLAYRPDIDGLRAIAVLSVVVFHAGGSALGGGFVGVDVFLVISGYLICSLLGQELADGRFSVLRFYERRCRRILPALFAMLLVCGLIAWRLLLPPDMADFCRSVAASALFVSNLYFWRTSGYFDGGSEFKPLLHTWSLGVEEQFYIVMPLLLWAAARWRGGRHGPWIAGAAIASFALGAWGLTHAPTATFYLLPTRFWELATGALIALGGKRLRAPAWLLEAMAAAGLAAIAYAVTRLTAADSFPGWNALYPCLGSAAIIFAGERRATRVSLGLGAAPLVFIGRISYSLYLWHWPLLAFARYRAPGELDGGQTAGVLAVALLAAILSWRYVERPFRAGAGGWSRRTVFAGSAAAIAAAVAFAVVGGLDGGFGARFPGYAHQQIAGADRYNEGTCFLDGDQTFQAWGADRCFLSRGRGKTVLLWGDSFAAHYAPGLLDEAPQTSADFLQYTASACPPVFDYYTAARPNCERFNANLPRIIARYRIETVVMAARWESLLKRGVTPNAIVATVQRLNAMGVKVYVIGQSPVYRNDVQTLYAQSVASLATTPTAVAAAAGLSFDPDVNARLARALPVGTFIDPLGTFCRRELCDYRRNGEYLVADIGHLSSAGARLAVSAYFPFVDGR